MNLIDELFKSLCIHAGNTALFALKGHLGTAVDRYDTFCIIAEEIRTCSPEHEKKAHILELAADFFVSAGKFASGPDAASSVHPFPPMIENGANALIEGNLEHFETISKQVNLTIKSKQVNLGSKQN
jgi:hypothetical protein